RRFEDNDVHQIGYLPEERGLYKKMKVGEQALYFARLKGMSKSEAIRHLKHWFTKFEIQAWWNKKVEELSKGMQQKVQFITTIIHKPKLLIFDEPFSGFDPINVNLLKNEIIELKKSGSTIIFSTHDMGSVEELCDYITLINKSKTLLEGAVHDIKMKYKENAFEIGFRGSPGAVIGKLNGYCQVTDQYEERGNNFIRIKAERSFSGNDMLGLILPVATVTSFNEIIPTMNEIFINVVEAQNKQNTSNNE
ncbi:MAG TPA: ATP-binding cassette domain-containing protein, partial [Bacteroidales bacterium]|nr:ATP-binding cassette domain-containing protein [Bacteroidales bacterium]